MTDAHNQRGDGRADTADGFPVCGRLYAVEAIDDTGDFHRGVPGRNAAAAGLDGGARGMIERQALALFAILFVWQFPHFMSIAWLNRDDYARAPESACCRWRGWTGGRLRWRR
jgi:hypothetical protein